jgi:AcrR family transcriptional regulator
MTGSAQPAKRSEIVELALARFYDGGFLATGVDSVIAGSGISKRTLYKYFPSKDELIEEVLATYAVSVGKTLFEPVHASGLEAKAKILMCFDTRREMLEAECRGCLAIRGSQEFPGQSERLVLKCRELGAYVEAQFVNLCQEAGLAEAQALGMQITVLFQGALLLSQAYGNSRPFDAAKTATETLLADAAERPAA